MRTAPLVVLSLALAACGGSANPPANPLDPNAPTWHADVAPIVSRSCAGCHVEGAIGGFPLNTFDDARTIANPILDSVQSRRMPPWGADNDCNTYENNRALTQDEVDTIVAWVDGGAQEGDPADSPGPVAPLTPPTLDRVDLSLSLAEPYTPQASPDDYRCFLMEWPYEERVWVTGYEVVPDNAAIVHHVIPFLIDPDDAEEYRALDAADPAPGYPCYGGPGGDIETLINTRWLGSWAPGGGARTMPEGYGVRVKPGSLIAVQLHYYSLTTPGPDQTQVNLRVSETELGWADVQPWTEVAWVLGLGMEIPAKTDDVTHVFEYTEEDSPFTLHDLALHMHTMGQSGEMRVIRQNGDEECLVSVPRWDFNWQTAYALAEPVTVNPGDTVRLTCTWDNPTDDDAAWGEGTGDEMCLGITLLTSDD